MADLEIKEIIEKKVSRFKDKLNIKEMQLRVLLEITNAINLNLSTLEVLDIYEHFVKEQLSIEKLILYSKGKKWRCLLEYGVSGKELDSIDVERDMIDLKDITSVTSVDNNSLATFDMILPVYHGEKPLAYLILGDQDNESISISSIIKHLNFLQLLTNIVVSALENRQLAKDKLKEEQEKKRLIEKQNEILEEQVAERTKDLRAEKEESERLLHNILPKDIADELKLKGSTKAQSFKEVSILFSDFKGFTIASAKMSPEFLVNELNDIFKAFDSIMDKYDVEKIKTIGDAYMAVCGVPKSYDLHAVQAVNAGTEMIEFLKERGKTAKIKWEMRVGIHSGPLVAGVVGTKKFTYDVWGDTVNTASRMESNSEPGKINVSAKTFSLIKDYFNCDYRGKLEAKGKGQIDMYFVIGEKGSDEFLKVKTFILNKLKKELPDELTYHGLHHTRDVYNSVLNLAINENLNEKDLELVKLAALFHDSGYTRRYKEHEEAGCELAREILPKYKYTDKQITVICETILATKIPQVATTKLQKIICDADLDYLGRHDFKLIGDSLFKELNVTGTKINEQDWNRLQVKFLENHKYFTKTAKTLRQPVKAQHVKKLKELVASYDN